MGTRVTLPVAKAKRGRPKTSDLGRILSIREEEILVHLRKGEKYKEIGEILSISEHTVRKHASNIYKELKVENKIMAINKYFEKN